MRDLRALADSVKSRVAVVALITAALSFATLGLGVAAAPASKGVTDFFGVSTPRGIAVNESTGNVYVATRSHHVQIFDSSGEHQAQFGVQGDAEGEFDRPRGIAIDQDTGDVFVTDRGNHRVQRFDANGDFQLTWGWGVDDGSAEFQICTADCQGGIAGSGDGQFGETPFARMMLDISPPDGDPSTGRVYVPDPENNRVQEFDLDGNFLDAWGEAGDGVGEFGSTQPRHAAVDEAGIVYIGDSSQSNRIQRYDTVAEDFLDPITPGNVPELPAISIIDMEVDPDAARLFVSISEGSHFLDGVHELDISAHPPIHVETHATHVGTLSTGRITTGLGLNASTGTLYLGQDRSTSHPNNRFGNRVYIVDDVAAPTATVTDASPTPFTAVLEGEVNPNNSFAAYRFEVSDDGGATWRQVPRDDDIFDDVVIGGGTDPIPVSEEIRNLQVNTEHVVRLVGWQYWGPDSGVSAEVTFQTPAIPPEVLVTARRALSPTEASLRGRIQPHNADTDYHFEWGTDTSYGEVTPVGSIIDAGTDIVHVDETIDGLEPGTTYHFRLVTESEGGVTQGPDRTFTTPEGPKPPLDERSYELVSPVDKGGGEVSMDANAAFGAVNRVSEDGSVVTYVAFEHFPGVESIQSGTFRQQYVSRRGEEAWTTHGVHPPYAPARGTPCCQSGESFVVALSEDLGSAVVATNDKLTPEADALPHDVGLYLQDHTSDPPSWTLLSAPADPLPPASWSWTRIRFSVATPDLSHVVFTSRRKLLPEGQPDIAFADFGLYQWAEGELHFVSVLPDGELADRAVAGAQATHGGETGFPGTNPISEDGSRVYFSVEGAASGSRLYLRENIGTAEAETKIVSASERSGDDPDVATDGTLFVGASSDGSVALFTSPHRLTDDATANGHFARDLYRWEADADPGERLSNLTPQDSDGAGVGNHQVDAGTPTGLRGAGDVAMTDDASQLYFLARGALTPEAEPGERNLYLWREGEGIRHLAVLDDLDTGIGGWETTSPIYDRLYRDSRMTADGSVLLFASRAQLTDYDNAGHRQLYLYDADADDLTCVSCNPLSEPSTADATMYRDVARPFELPRNLSDDGTRVFFETTESLVPEDTNERRDVYEWDEGELRLVSDGSQPHGSHFIGASADGEDVFFVTRARLSGWDRDSLVDVYRATTRETFPDPPPEPEPCVGDECQDPAVGGPAPLNLGTPELRTPEVERPSECAALVQRARRHMAVARRSAVRARRQMALARRAVARRPAGNQARRALRQARQARRQAQRSRVQAQRSIRAARNCLRSER